MIWGIAVLALASASAGRAPVACNVIGDKIIVRFYDYSSDPVLDKFAIVQAGTPQGGAWLSVVDSDPPLRLSPYKPGMKRLVIDTLRQLAVDYDKGPGRPVRAFPRPGRYMLVFSENLGMDWGDMIAWTCRVRVR